MKLPFYQLNTHLHTKTLSSIYLISGSDPLLKQEASILIRAAAKNKEFNEHKQFVIESLSDWELFLTTAYSVSLIPSKQLLEIETLEAGVSVEAGKLLKKYADAIPSDTLLLIRLPQVDKKTEKSTWFQAMEKNGLHIPIWPPGREALAQWIFSRAHSKNITLTKQMAETLAEHAEGNLTACDQTLEKLALLSSTQPIDATLLSTLYTDEAQYNIFDLAEAIIHGNKTRALRIIQCLKQEGTELTLILWAITREWRMLANAIRQKREQIAWDAIYRTHRIPVKRQSAIQQLSRQYTEQECWKRLMAAAQIDRIIKGILPGDPWEAIEKMSIQ